MNAQHTPGPWRSEQIWPERYDEFVEHVSIVGSDGHEVANAWEIANGRLIAAAPELLDAARRIDAWLAEIDRPFSGGKAITFGDDVRALRAAIANAEGQ